MQADEAAGPAKRRRRSYQEKSQKAETLKAHFLSKRADPYTFDRTRRPEMQEISRTQGWEIVPYYFHALSSGAGVTIYVIDTGFNKNLLPEFTTARLDWLFPETVDAGYLPWGSNNDEADTPDNHGTAMVAKAASRKYGIAKRANVVMVRMPRHRIEGLWITFDALLDALLKIENDAKAKNLQGGFVVNMSLSKLPSISRSCCLSASLAYLSQTCRTLPWSFDLE